MKLKVVVALTFMSFMTCCHFTSTSRNDESDKDEASSITYQFYKYYAQHEFSQTHKFFSKDFFKTTDSVKFDSSLSNVLKKYGEIKDYNIIDWSSIVISGTTSSSEYQLLYKVIYVNDSTKDLFKLKKIDDEIKIIEYNINHNEI